MKHTKLIKCPYCLKMVKYTQTEEGKVMFTHKRSLNWRGVRGVQNVPCQGSNKPGVVMPGYAGGG